ncbi:UNVERIFIED_CONTAM: hypothetical protein Sangu_0662600 [Sesamum angustifolium]|uniref:Uncharacterized protein n=1 Tax=Sesamum angustifolium TaxID=2727405 RepID=A0AAW2QDI2_9LAMI
MLPAKLNRDVAALPRSWIFDSVETYSILISFAVMPYVLTIKCRTDYRRFGILEEEFLCLEELQDGSMCGYNGNGLGRKLNADIWHRNCWKVWRLTCGQDHRICPGQDIRWGLAWQARMNGFSNDAKCTCKSSSQNTKAVAYLHANCKISNFSLSGPNSGLQRQHSAFHVLQSVESYIEKSGASCKLDAAAFEVDVFQLNPGTLLVRGTSLERESCAAGISAPMFFALLCFFTVANVRAGRIASAMGL